MNKSAKKISLHRETLQILGSDGLAEVAGGLTAYLSQCYSACHSICVKTNCFCT